MQVTVLEDLSCQPEFAREWDWLASSTGHYEVFYSHAWHVSLFSAFGNTFRPVVVTARDSEGALIGIAGLGIQAHRPSTAVLAGSMGADYEDILCTPGRCEEFLIGLLQVLRSRGLNLRFSRLPANSVTAGCLPRATRQAGYLLLQEQPWVAPIVSFAEPQVRGDLRRVIEGSCQRSQSRLAKAGQVKVNHWFDWRTVHSRLPEFFELHIARFMTSGRSSFFLESPRRRFIAESARRLCPSESLAYSEVRVNDSAVAASISFLSRGRWLFYLPTFDPAWATYSPGRLLLKQVLLAALERPDIDVLDLGIGTEEYKLQLANDSTAVLRLRLSRTLLHHAEAHGRRVVWSAMQRSDRLRKAVLETRAHLANGNLHNGVSIADPGPDVQAVGNLELVRATSRLLARAALACAGHPRSLAALAAGVDRADLADAEALALVRGTGDTATPVYVMWIKRGLDGTATAAYSWTSPGFSASRLADVAVHLTRAELGTEVV